MTDDLAADRERMIVDDLIERGITDARVLAAMRAVPRERFVPDRRRSEAYADHPLPIGQGQTISQPFIVALMADVAALESTDRVLEVGTGSGYGAAVLGHLAAEVVTIERHEKLASLAAGTIRSLGYDNVEVVVGDGSLGHPAGAPYDAIVVTAAGPEPPQSLLEQLVEGGRLVIPVGRRRGAQELLVYTRVGETFLTRDHGGVAFVPLIGEEGFSS